VSVPSSEGGTGGEYVYIYTLYMGEKKNEHRDLAGNWKNRPLGL
jgi:hypothetical protein